VVESASIQPTTPSGIHPTTSAGIHPTTPAGIHPTTTTGAAAIHLTMPDGVAAIHPITPAGAAANHPTTPVGVFPTTPTSVVLPMTSSFGVLTTSVSNLPITSVFSSTSSASSIRPVPIVPATQARTPSTDKDLVSKTYWMCGGCPAQFGFVILKSIFDSNTLRTSNLSGKKGLGKLDEQVIELVKCNIRNLFNINNEGDMKRIITSINLKLKNYRRYLK